MVDSPFNGCNNNLNGFFFSQIFLVLGFHDSHRSQGAGAQSKEWERVHVSVVANFDELGTLNVVSSKNQVGANVTSVVECMGG